jgi:hypothetical protein
MKPGDCYIDEHFEPDTVVLKITDQDTADGYICTVVYTSDPHLMRKGAMVTRYSDDEELIPVAMITIDDKLMIIKL